MGWFIRKLKGGIRCVKENGVGYTTRHFGNKCKRKLSKIGVKILGKINKLFRKISSALNLGFIEIIKVKTYVKDERYGHVYFVFLFGWQIYPTKRQHRTNAWVDPNQPVMYFKIDRMSDFAKPCIQHWVNIACHMRADYYFICDNKFLKYHILRTVNFPGADIKFMPSSRRPLKSICKALCVPYWENATYAHLTPFYHAKKCGAKRFWAIDADDTMICLQHKRVVEILKAVQAKANENDMSAISLDIWRSRTLGRHWSWGIAYVNDNVDFYNIFDSNPDLSWTTPYQEIDVNFNLDWFFTYLKDFKKIKIETFFVENMQFIHWGKFLREPIRASILIWSNGKLTFPILNYIFKNRQLGEVDIADCHKIDINIDEKESQLFWEHEVATVKWMNPKTRFLHNVGSFSMRQKSIEKL